MTPEEKAQELVDKYAIWNWNEVVCDYESAKQCALIAVDEILNIGCIEVPYWLQVKSEIEAL
jgi:hypothetical protein